MKKVILLALFLGLFSCQKKETTPKETTPKEAEPKEEKCTPGKEKKLEMYQMSEMAALMEQMYVDNKRLKVRIQKGDDVGSFPKHYLKIFTAKFTDDADNDLFFKVQAKRYIAAQLLIYNDPNNVKQHFNEGVDACLRCHENKCGGPIPRIKKLYIK